jgi:hypothetical protein
MAARACSRLRTGRAGTKRATSFPWRVIATSSPCSTVKQLIKFVLRLESADLAQKMLPWKLIA